MLVAFLPLTASSWSSSSEDSSLLRVFESESWLAEDASSRFFTFTAGSAVGGSAVGASAAGGSAAGFFVPGEAEILEEVFEHKSVGLDSEFFW